MKNTQKNDSSRWFKHLFIFLLLAKSLGSHATTFTLENDQSRVVGYNLVVFSRAQDTLLDIARRFDIGYSEIVDANPNLDVWLPGGGQRVLVPNRFILPEAPQEGIIINLAEMRLYYYPKQKANGIRRVITHPIGIGREGWQTPLGKTRIIQKRKNPTWTPPASIIAEHLAKGDPLPKVVPAGPDNPLGDYAMRLDMPGYLLHGTNRPYGVGLRVSHGCIRLFPEDIEQLFTQVELDTSVEIVYQPFKAALEQQKLYVEAHHTQADMEQGSESMTPMISAILAVQAQLNDDDWLFAQEMIKQSLGVVSPIDMADDDIVEDVWFIDAGLDEWQDHHILSELGLDDALWPVNGVQGEVLLGPFVERQEADRLADTIYNRTGEPAWVVLLTEQML